MFLSSPGRVSQNFRAPSVCVLPSSARRVHPRPLSTLVTSEARFVGSGVRYTQGSENPGAEVVRTVKNSLIG